jgi:hypothetical protein
MKHLKWIIISIGIFLLLMPLAIRVDDDPDEREWLGRVNNRPEDLRGTWVIGEKVFEANDQTEFKKKARIDRACYRCC